MSYTRNITVSLAAAALAVLNAGSANAWSQTVGTHQTKSPCTGQNAPCTNTASLSGGQVQVTTNTFKNGNTFTYQFDIQNLSDPYGVTGFGVDFGQSSLPSDLYYFIGSQPINATTVYHISGVGHNGSVVMDNSEDAALGLTQTQYPGDWKAQSGVTPDHLHNVVVFQGVNGHSITKVGSLSSEYTFSFHNSSTANSFEGDPNRLHEYFYIQTSANLCNKNFYLTDGHHIAPLHGLAPTPEPGSVVGLLVGGLGLGLLGVRARRKAA